MDEVKEILLQFRDGKVFEYEEPYTTIECKTEEDYEGLVNVLNKYNDASTPVPLEEWGEDIGDCLWWKFPIEEPPYCGSPLDENFPDYVTHFTRLIIPKESESDNND